ncbi:hypothetical protein GCM10022242_00150 [Nocardioides panacisoli]|uniref:Uncharacterized protein n=1 Tax=Nocardioides panacisoli TaxID=627624 RepID=A0ABP7HV82_9ACTN
MSASQIVIDAESGTYTGRWHHSHNGYAGDFWTEWPTHKPGHSAVASNATPDHARQ